MEGKMDAALSTVAVLLLTTGAGLITANEYITGGALIIIGVVCFLVKYQLRAY